jgi:hypothetical protein
MKEKAQYQYDCVNCPKVKELDFIIQNARRIPYRTFIKNVDKEKIEEFNTGFGIPIHKDYAVSFYKSKLPNGNQVYFFDHSSIEYIFY